jgi:hypothetical protein
MARLAVNLLCQIICQQRVEFLSLFHWRLSVSNITLLPQSDMEGLEGEHLLGFDGRDLSPSGSGLSATPSMMGE